MAREALHLLLRGHILKIEAPLRFHVQLSFSERLRLFTLVFQALPPFVIIRKRIILVDLAALGDQIVGVFDFHGRFSRVTVLGDEEVVERLIHHMLLLLELSQQRQLSLP